MFCHVLDQLVQLFCFGVSGSRVDPTLCDFRLDDFPRKSYECVFAQYATLNECAVSRNSVLEHF